MEIVLDNNIEESNIENNQVTEEAIETETEPEVEEIWEWEYDTPKNHKIDETVLESVHNTIDEYPMIMDTNGG